MRPGRAARCGAALAAAALAAACGAAEPGVECRNLDSGHRARYRGPGAIADCLSDPRMQRAGERREARAGPGAFDFGGARRFELDAGWTLAGAGPQRTTLYASRPTTSVFRDNLYSALLVRGAGVTLRGFSFDGDCARGPRPGPDCRRDASDTLVAIVVACGYGAAAGPDCDVDGLLVEDVRVLRVKTPFVATSREARPERGEKGLFANFRDFSWTIRRFRTAGPDDPFRYARVFELGNAATPDVSQGPGVGVAAPRRYRVRIEDTEIDTSVGKHGGRMAGVLTAAVNDDRVTLEIELRRSHLRGTERVVALAAHALDGEARDDGSVSLRCEDSEIVADLGAWGARVEERGVAPCPPFPAALYVGELARPGGLHREHASLVRCGVAVRGWISLCPEPAAVELGAGAAADGIEHASLCLEDARVEGAIRGHGRVDRAGPC